MEIVFHLGAHCTDRDELVRCLVRNKAALAEQGIAVPEPETYRQEMRQLAHEMASKPTDETTQEAVIDSLTQDDHATRIVLSNENHLAMAQWAVANDKLYPSAAERVAHLAHLFPSAQLTIAMGLRDPATLLPALYARLEPNGNAGELTSCDPGKLRWSDMVLRMQSAAPGLKLILWRDEDAPLIWPEILRTVSGHDPARDLTGWLAYYWSLTAPSYHDAMRRYFAKNPAVSDQHRRKVLATMLERFIRAEALEMDPLLPNWTDETVDALSAIYDEDIDVIASLPGVTFLEP